MVMVWAAITADGRSLLIFIDCGVKLNAEYYRENMLEDALKDLGTQTFRPQDSAPLHSACATKEWLKMRFLASFPPHNAHRNRRTPIRWTIVPGVFWKARLAPKTNKV